MGNPPFGSNFIEGPLGVVSLHFDGIDLGKTVDEANLEFVGDLKDIKYAQNGTQPYDKVYTGMAWKMVAKLGEQTWARLNKLMPGLTVVGNNAKVGRDLYRSGRATFAKVLEIFRVDSDGVPSTDLAFRMVALKAMPIPKGNIGEFGPDKQRAQEVEWYFFYDEVHDCFGYTGYSSSLGIF